MGPTSADAQRRQRFEAIAAATFEPLQRFLGRRAGPDDAADALADTLLVVWRRLDDVPDDPLPWAYGVARRCLANQRRGNERGLRLVGKVAAQPAVHAVDPQEHVERQDPELHAALGTLSPAEAEIVRLWAWERLEPREIAAVLELSPNAVSVALSRARRKLARQLEGSEHGRQDRPGAGHLQGAGTTEPEGDGR